jgi:hypothetical protein
MNYFQGEYGIGTNPESFAVYGGSRYFVDANRGAVLKLGGNGIQRISSSEDAANDSIKMHSYFTDVLKRRRDSQRPFFIYGAYDKDNEEYILAFEEVRKPDQIIITEKPSRLKPSGISLGDFLDLGLSSTTTTILGEIIEVHETIAWSEPKNRWVTFYPFGPEYMGNSGTGLVMFKNGSLYTHDTNQTRNNFFGAQYSSSVTPVFNEAPSVNKFYKHINLKSTTAWSAVISNQFGQASNLITGDFEEFEGVATTRRRRA